MLTLGFVKIKCRKMNVKRFKENIFRLYFTRNGKRKNGINGKWPKNYILVQFLYTIIVLLVLCKYLFAYIFLIYVLIFFLIPEIEIKKRCPTPAAMEIIVFFENIIWNSRIRTACFVLLIITSLKNIKSIFPSNVEDVNKQKYVSAVLCLRTKNFHF